MKPHLLRFLSVAPLSLLLAWTVAQAAPLKTEFPPGFKWCVETSAHQIEGDNSNSDWWDWEQLPGKIKNGEKSGPACDHWNRLSEDTELLHELGVSQYRFSIEWAKVEPTPGNWDANVVAHYRRELAILKEAGVEPMITLYHFALPHWLSATGGWATPTSAEAFARFSRFVYTEVAPNTRDWITLNEPLVVLLAGYVAGTFPPGIKDIKQLGEPLKNIIRAHGLAYHAIHEEAARLHQDVRIGIAHHLRVFDPDSHFNPILHFLVPKLDAAFNWALGEACESGHLNVSIPMTYELSAEIPEAAHIQDFIGVNYYSRDMVAFNLGGQPGLQFLVNERSRHSDLGWEIYPFGFYRILKATAAHFPGKPILVTENGIADAADAQRSDFLISHLSAMHRAISEGVPVEGYCHWSLLDNFEWLEGFKPRFGLYSVDYATQRRTPRASALLYQKIIKNNGF